MKSMTVPLLMILGLGTVVLGSGAIASEPTEPVAKADVEKAEEFQPPPGFAIKKRGKYTLYCKREAPMGTRLKTETCYDEAQMRDYMLALAENKRDVDRIRAICSNPCVCGDPGAC